MGSIQGKASLSLVLVVRLFFYASRLGTIVVSAHVQAHINSTHAHHTTPHYTTPRVHKQTYNYTQIISRPS
jgi:hypothetical protein